MPTPPVKDPYLMFIIGVAGEHGGEVVGTFLKSYDLSTEPGGLLDFTRDVGEALQFEGFLGVVTAWKEQSTCKPLRPDGKPNRPLTYFTIEPVPLVRAMPAHRTPQ